MKLNIKGIKLTESQEELYKYATDRNTKYIIANWSRQSRKNNNSNFTMFKMVNNEGTRNYIHNTYLFFGKENIF